MKVKFMDENGTIMRVTEVADVPVPTLSLEELRQLVERGLALRRELEERAKKMSGR